MAYILCPPVLARGVKPSAQTHAAIQSARREWRESKRLAQATADLNLNWES